MSKLLVSIVVGIGVLLACASGAHAQEKVGKEMWLFWQNNLANEKSVEDLLKLIDRAGALGFTHLLISDTRSNHLGDLWQDEPVRYPKNVAKIRAACAKYGMTALPAVFDVGYSNATLWNDPNLAEGSPVKDAPFLVKGGEADAAGEPVVLKATPDVVGPAVKVDNGVFTVTDGKGNGEVTWQLTLPKYRCYHVSLKVKTQGYTGRAPEIRPVAANAPANVWLQYETFGVKRDQDWTEANVVFNTLDNTNVALHIGVGGESKGTVSWKDVRVEDAGLVNVLRRPGCPVEVKLVKDGGSEVLKEGQDYEPIQDPNLGNRPWKGSYKSWHEVPKIKIKDTAKLPDGSKLLVSWYHPIIIYDGQVSMCISEPKTNGLLADTARRIKELWGVDTYFMEHDEFRHANHCTACTDRKMTSGQMLAENIAYCSKLLEGSRRVVWADMFDPHHNAVKDYYLAGDMSGSWKGMPKDVIPMLWYHEVREQSAKFFREQGHEMMMSIYYDTDNPQFIRDWVATARKVGGVRGFQYTTWAQNYKNLESFAKTLKEALAEQP